MEEQLPYYEDRQQEAWEDYNNLVADRDHLRARNAELEEQINNPKMTYCAFCGEKYDIEDREKAIELITEHVQVCPKHPVAFLKERNAELEAERDDYKGKMEASINLLVLEKKCNGLLIERINELEAEVARLKKILNIKPKKQRRKLCKNCAELGHSCFGSGKRSGFGHDFCVEASDGLLRSK